MPLNSTRSPAVETISTTPHDPLLIDADEVGQLLGWCARTIRRKESAGLLPKPLRVGGSVRWRTAEIHEWVAAGCPNRATWERMDRA